MAQRSPSVELPAAAVPPLPLKGGSHAMTGLCTVQSLHPLVSIQDLSAGPGAPRRSASRPQEAPARKDRSLREPNLYHLSCAKTHLLPSTSVFVSLLRQLRSLSLEPLLAFCPIMPTRLK